jgi:hypothetical protein
MDNPARTTALMPPIRFAKTSDIESIERQGGEGRPRTRSLEHCGRSFPN